MKARFVNTLRFCSNPLPPLRSWRCRRSFTSFNRHRRRNNSYGGWNVRQCRSGCQHLELALYRSLVRSIPRRECLDLLPSLRRYVFSVFTGSSERIDPSSSESGLFNPAVTLGMYLIGALKPLRAVLLLVSQFAAGIAGSAIVYGLLPGKFKSANLAKHSSHSVSRIGDFNVQTTLSANTSIVRGVFIETFLTALLMMAM